jgi:small subunit ribosomal protein S4
MIGDRKVDIPSYTVTVEEENNVHFAPESKIPEMLEKTKSKTPSPETPVEGEVEAPVEETTEAPKDQSSSTE